MRSYLEYTTGSYKTWQAIRNKCENDAGGVCEICGDTSQKYGVKHSTECHEVWSYDEEIQIQKLEYLIALCVRCHKIVHLNQHKAIEEDWKSLLKDYEYLNNITAKQAKNYYDKSLSRQKRQSSIKFKIDLSFIQGPSNFDPHAKEFEEFLIKFKEKD
ncbi:hypothetical protein [Variovorax sp. E3]|uniref:hypothetical protein n=1 Tax=Variovorax sp. E3 TaxID=1914993 RepID=UPI0018DB2F88|nr:hypothetical protein [Variovorax sp. E3]